jgi:glyoxylase-like metal-dependent hydrolase (beta-lactamase superfamily II)
LIVSGTIGVVIDTLPFPQETSQIALFARRRCPDGVRYVIYTQHQADHTYGAFLFPRAEIISHTLCRDILLERGVKALEQAKAVNRELELVRLRIPTITFDKGSFSLRLPGKTLDIFPTPGHTPDAISVIFQEEKILFAGDTIMAIPTVGEGDMAQLRASTEAIAAMPLESIVQGHGEIILRGEIKDNIKRSLNYLDQLNNKVRKVVETGGSLEDARKITIEQCGLQRVLLNGMVTQLHAANVVALYNRFTAELGVTHPAATAATEVASEQAASKPRKTATKRSAARKTAQDSKSATKTKRGAASKAAQKSVKSRSAQKGTSSKNPTRRRST